jgi:hypothetical protein
MAFPSLLRLRRPLPKPRFGDGVDPSGLAPSFGVSWLFIGHKP